MIVRALLALAAALTMTWSAAAADAPRAPTGKWVLDFAETQCLASRTYGTEAEPLTLALRPSPNGEVYEFIILRAGSGSRYAREVPATVRIGERAPVSTKLLVYKPGKDKPRLARASLPAVAAHDLRAAKSLAITAKGEGDLHLALSGTAPLMAEMDRCLLSLQDYWNISPFRFAALRSPATGSLQRVFGAEDYPDVGWGKDAEGTVEVRLLIDEAGKVADCMLTRTSGNALLDAQSCARIRERARYTPAVGADGKPARAAASGRITWRRAD